MSDYAYMWLLVAIFFLFMLMVLAHATGTFLVLEVWFKN